MSISPSQSSTTLTTLRRRLTWLLIFGLAGTTTDLLLLAHYEDSWQLIPFAALAGGFLASGAMAVGAASGRRPGMLRLFQSAMVLLILAGLLGTVLHYRANMEFKLEMDPTIGGVALFWSVIRAHAPPALAPGTLVLLGLLGLVTVDWRSGGARRSSSASTGEKS